MPDSNCLGWQKGRSFVVSSDRLCSFFLAEDAKVADPFELLSRSIQHYRSHIRNVCSKKHLGRNWHEHALFLVER